jgi:prephenate dehydrogenase
MQIAPAAAVSPEAVKLVSDIADFLEMKPRFLDPVEHDGLAGLMEVMPTVLGAMYFKTVQQSKGKTDLLRIANIRFANSTANLREEAVADLVTMWRWNKDNLLHHLEQTVQALETLREILMDDDPMALEVYIDQILDGFTEWEIRRRDNRWDEDIVDAPNIQPGFGGFGGVMNNFFNLRKRKDDE